MEKDAEVEEEVAEEAPEGEPAEDDEAKEPEDEGPGDVHDHMPLNIACLTVDTYSPDSPGKSVVILMLLQQQYLITHDACLHWRTVRLTEGTHCA